MNLAFTLRQPSTPARRARRSLTGKIAPFLAVSTLALACSAASAATWNVRTDGSDTSCNGTVNASAASAPNCAFQTISKSAGTAAAGDTVTVQAGTYSGGVSFSKSGAAGSPISFRAAGAAVIRGNVKVNGSYVVLDGLTVSPPSAGGYGAVTIAGQNNVLRNCLVTNYGASAGDQATAIIFETSGSYNTVEGCTIRDLNDIDVFHVNGDHQTIRNNIVKNVNQVNYSLNHTDFIQTWGWSGSRSSNVLVEGNLVTDSTAQLGNITTDDNPEQRDWTFRNNVFANVGAALFSGIPRTKYYNNLFYKVGRAQGYAVSLYTQQYYSSVGVEFVNNVFIDNLEDVHFQSARLSDVAVFTNNYFSGASYSAKTNGEAMGSNYINGGNPAFVNAAAYDYHLNSGSLLIGKGATLSSFSTDKDAKPRSGSWDIGPYEYGAAATTVAPPTNLTVQ